MGVKPTGWSQKYPQVYISPSQGNRTLRACVRPMGYTIDENSPKGRFIVFPWMGGLVVKAPAYEWRVQGSSPG